MAKNYIDNLGEEVHKGMLEKARQGHWPNVAPTTRFAAIARSCSVCI